MCYLLNASIIFGFLALIVCISSLKPKYRRLFNITSLISFYFLVRYNDECVKVVLKNALENCKYTLHQIQKELLQILSSRVRKHIREEIGDSKFCIVVDEGYDESKKEQITLC